MKLFSKLKSLKNEIFRLKKSNLLKNKSLILAVAVFSLFIVALGISYFSNPQPGVWKGSRVLSNQTQPSSDSANIASDPAKLTPPAEESSKSAEATVPPPELPKEEPKPIPPVAAAPKPAPPKPAPLKPPAPKPAPPAATPAPPASTGCRGERLTASGIIAATNAERTKAGLPTLKESSSLDGTALSKAKDMLARQYFAHGDLAKQYNYQVLGENLIMGVFKTEAEAVRQWMNSSGHRANIVSTRYSQIGVGIISGIYNGACTWLGVQHFR